MLKRSTSDVSSPPSDDIDRKPTLPTEEPKVKKAKNGHPCKTTSSRLGTSNGTSNKAILGKMIVEAGLKALSRADAQVATGLSKDTLKEMLRPDRGSVPRALYRACENL